MTEKEIPNTSEEITENDDDFTIESEYSDERRKKMTKHERQRTWRRHKVLQLSIQGVSNSYELAKILHVSQSTCYRDLEWLRAKVTEELKYHIQHRVPWHYKLASEGISSVLQHAWQMLIHDDKVNKIATMSLIVQCYKDLLDISTNASIITEALRSVEKMKQEILGLDTSKGQSPKGEQENDV